MQEFKRKPMAPQKMSVGWVYASYCCSCDANPRRWLSRERMASVNAKKKTLRSHRTGIRR